MATVGAKTQGPFVSVAPKLGFIGGFDGVRGIGILMVLFNHAYSPLSPSFAGIIDVFFVMSAFLITSLLMQEYRSRETIDMRKFYSRRAIRLLPSAYLCVLTWIVVTVLFARDRLPTLLAEAAAAVTYIYELIFPVGLGQIDPTSTQHLSIDQFWSLAVEEQFYLFIAVTVLVCIRKRWMVHLAIGMVLLATWIGFQRWSGVAGPVPIPADPASANPLYRGVSLLWLSRPDSLMWGVALAVVNARMPDPLPDAFRRWLPRVGIVGLVVAAVTMLAGSPFLNDIFTRAGLPYPYVPMAPATRADAAGGIYWISFGHTLTALAFVPGMWAMARCKDWSVNRALAWKPLRFLGRMSYTVYVWHTLVYFIVLDLLGGNEILGEKWRVPILAVIAIVACLPVFYGVERRALDIKLRYSVESEVLDLNTGRMVSIEEAKASGKASRPAIPEGSAGTDK